MRSQNVRAKRNDQHEEEIDLYLSEAFGVGISAVVLFMTIALISYHPHDTSLFYFDSELSLTRNWCGVVGAHLSAILFHMLGVAAYAFVGALTILAYMFLLGYRHGRSWLSLSLLPLCIAAAATLAALYNIDFTHGLPGGELGSLVSEYLTKFLGFYGAAVLSWSVLWVSTVMVLRVSFVRGIMHLAKSISSSRATFFF
jgi:hypothetical protein